MSTIYYEKDVNRRLLDHLTIAVIGMGSQGHAHALNLKDSGLRVTVGLRKESPHWAQAVEWGLDPRPIAEAVALGDLVMILIPDEEQAQVYRREIAPHLRPGRMLLFAHGFSIHYGQVVPREDVDVAMVAPKGPGNLVRREFTMGRGVPGLVAVARDVSGRALSLALAYAAGIGCTRAGLISTTFGEETETDLFGEQAVLCGGITALMKAGFDTLVEAGYQPEMAYFECVHEMKLIVDLIHEGGFSHMRRTVSNTAEFGDYLTGGDVINAETRQRMRTILDRVRSGRFAKKWILENLAGRPYFLAKRRLESEHPVERVGRELRRMMPWLRSEPPGGAHEKP